MHQLTRFNALKFLSHERLVVHTNLLNLKHHLMRPFRSYRKVSLCNKYLKQKLKKNFCVTVVTAAYKQRAAKTRLFWDTPTSSPLSTGPQ